MAGNYGRQLWQAIMAGNYESTCVQVDGMRGQSPPNPEPLAGSFLMNNATQTEIEAAVFRRLLSHLDSRKDVQNIDLMNLAGFCRNCLAKWYSAAATEAGETVDYEAAREVVYGMPYSQWKNQYQQAATPEQLAAFANAKPRS